MALINCPECGKEISDTVKKCPHCGFGIRAKKQISKKGKLLLILVPAVLVVLCVGAFIFLNTLTETEQQVVNCVQEVKDRLKNPDSLKVYEIQYHAKDESKESDFEDNYLMVYFGAENGFGGTNSSYATFKDWSLQGFFDPNEDYNSDSTDIDELLDQLAGLAIYGYWDSEDNTVFNVDKIMSNVK